jgi:hypothetical protein
MSKNRNKNQTVAQVEEIVTNVESTPAVTDTPANPETTATEGDVAVVAAVQEDAETTSANELPKLKKGDMPALLKEHGSKSAVIRLLASKGYGAGPISKALGIRYQFAYNVLSRVTKNIQADAEEANTEASVDEEASAAAVAA